ncbi:hypothetical protein [Mesonia sp.]|uniref:hypothetical protein n=2 Tax=Mesonia sp. TaxID=1960830 RepID=UPI003F96453F
MILFMMSCIGDNTEVKVPKYKSNKENIINKFKEAEDVELNWSFKSGFINGEFISDQNLTLNLEYPKKLKVDEKFLEEKINFSKRISDEEILNKKSFDYFIVNIYLGDSLIKEHKEKSNSEL